MFRRRSANKNECMWNLAFSFLSLPRPISVVFFFILFLLQWLPQLTPPLPPTIVATMVGCTLSQCVPYSFWNFVLILCPLISWQLMETIFDQFEWMNEQISSLLLSSQTDSNNSDDGSCGSINMHENIWLKKPLKLLHVALNWHVSFIRPIAFALQQTCRSHSLLLHRFLFSLWLVRNHFYYISIFGWKSLSFYSLWFSSCILVSNKEKVIVFITRKNCSGLTLLRLGFSCHHRI